ncbi:unnamed protein product [Rotaria sp. Silwood1]|nr:unnamed protein product [Rotaria sp. Silwood1]
MFDLRIIFLWIMISMAHSAYNSYHYVGCYTQVFYNSYFISSYMEPTLCFLLCETPIIYIQDNICRCSGSGLMDHNRQRDEYCTLSCQKPGDLHVRTDNTCGGRGTYSAYAEENFYTQHAHLFNYRIQFVSCELWNTSRNYDTFQVEIDQSSVKSPLNKLERCAAACLDQNATTKSIAFNGDNNQCLCITSRRLNLDIDAALNLTILSNNSCDRYCDNTLGDLEIQHKFKCGSRTDLRIWAIYDLNATCPIGFVYIKELKKCISAYERYSNSCPSPSMRYIYDGNVTWNIFLKIIEKLNLTRSVVSIDFDDDVTIDPSWKCPTRTTINTNNSNLSNRNFSTYYVLDSGCLRVHPYSLNSHMLFNRLCITNPVNEDSLSSNTTYYPIYGLSLNSNMAMCPPPWFDINTDCYRMSNDRKTIQEARNHCSDLSELEERYTKRLKLTSSIVDDMNMNNKAIHKLMNIMIDILAGEIAQYTSQWQVRLGFFLLDTNASNTEENLDLFQSHFESSSSLMSNIDVNLSSINEFQMINPNEDSNSSIKNDSCLVLTRSITDEKKRSTILSNTQINNCSKPRHVLCRTKSMLGFNSQQTCYSKPLTLGLPAMISNHLTHELCVSVCKTLRTILVVINMNKCYCVNTAILQIFDMEGIYAKYSTKDCGNPCPGNPHERCGNTNTIVILHVAENLIQPSFDNTNKQFPLYPDFVYDSCIHLNFTNQSEIYQFNLNHINDVHPRHCLELCKSYKQQYALLNSNKCLCTNILMRKKQDKRFTFLNYNCSQKCQDFQVTQDERRCVHIDLSVKKYSVLTARSYCKSIGGMLAKINDILEIQDIVPISTLTASHLDRFSFGYISNILNDTRYFWIDRTLDIMNNNTAADRSIRKCFQTSKSIDQNCIVLRREKILIDNHWIYEQCFTESDQCSSMFSIPVCVDKHLKFNLTAIPSTTDDDSSIISVNTSIDYSCGDDTDYHFVNDYCYKVSFHETTWNDAKAECERDNAKLFLPEKWTILSLIKFLFLRRHSYTSSGVAHIDIFADHQNRTRMRYNTTDGSTLTSLLDLNDFHSLCERRFHQRYEGLMLSTNLSTNEKNRSKMCAYVDFRSDSLPSISCDEISCNRPATVICQKLPIVKTRAVVAKR